MTTLDFPLAPGPAQAQRDGNLTDTLVLIGAMTALTAASAYQFFGWLGLLAAVLAVGLLALGAPSVPARLVMRLYRAVPVDSRTGGDLIAILDKLCQRAGLSAAPRLYVVPSLTINAFSVGTPQDAAIAITEGLLRKLNLRQIAAVMAHELSHVRNNDLRIMALADALSRTMQLLSWLALAMVLYYIPLYMAGNARVPWLGLALLYVAPSASTLLQLALARTREFAADLDAISLTADPSGLASALRLIECTQGRFWEELMFPSARRVPEPSLLRSHPSTDARIERLREIDPPAGLQPLVTLKDHPRVSLVGMSPSQMRPRYRLPGIWF